MLPRKFANALEIKLSLFPENKLIELALWAATYCKKEEFPLEITYGIVQAFAKVMGYQNAENKGYDIAYISLNYFNKPANPISLCELLTKPFDELPSEFKDGLMQLYRNYHKKMGCKVSDETAKKDWNDCTPRIKMQLLCSKLTNLGKYPLLISNEASDFYGLKKTPIGKMP